MRMLHNRLECHTRILAILLGFGLVVPLSRSQVQKPPSKQEGGTIRVNVGLVQTDVMVFDSRGKFVDNLKKGRFELRIDGKVQPISFFELVSAGSPHDEEIWAKAAGKTVTAPQGALNALAADTGGRFLKNTNALDAALINTLAEMSRYYLLGWSIDPESVQPGKYASIRVAVKGRTDLSVRVRQGALDLSQLVSQKRIGPEPLAPPPHRSEAEIYAQARSVVDLTRDELLAAYPVEMRDLEFEENSGRLGPLLEKAGEKVVAFFRDFPNTVSKEQVRMERLGPDGRVEASITRNYIYSFSPDKSGAYWEEARTESNGKPVDLAAIPGFFLAPGRAGMTAFLHPRHQNNCRFRYLGRQSSDPDVHVIAFAQKPESGDYLGSYQSQVMVTPALILYQGFVWVDSRTYQIVRMRTDLLAPRTDIGLHRQTSEIWFSAVRFQSVPDAFWLPREVVITNAALGQTCRNRHRYSDYQVFTVTVQEKVAPPQVKK